VLISTSDPKIHYYTSMGRAPLLDDLSHVWALFLFLVHSLLALLSIWERIRRTLIPGEDLSFTWAYLLSTLIIIAAMDRAGDACA
jgi:hypothetical protein